MTETDDGEQNENGDGPAGEEKLDQRRQEPRSALYRALAAVARHLWTIITALVIITMVTIAMLDVDLPRSVRVAAVAGVLSAPYWFVVAGKARDILWSPDHVYVNVLKAERLGRGQLWEIPSQRWRDLEARDGAEDWANRSLVYVRELDVGEGWFRGVWRGTLADRELMASLESVAEVRGQLLEDARIGFTLRNRAGSILFSALRKTGIDLAESYEGMVLPDEGEQLHESIDAAVSQIIDERDEEETDPTARVSDLEELDDLESDDLDLPDRPLANDGGRTDG